MERLSCKGVEEEGIMSACFFPKKNAGRQDRGTAAGQL